MKEYKIGDIVDIDGIKYIIKEEIETRSCKGCEYNERPNGCDFSIIDCRNMGCILKMAQEKEVEKQPLDLTKILDGCPYGTKFYSVLYGEVHFVKIANKTVYFTHAGGCTFPVCHNGLYVYNYQGECIIFPSKEQRDWSKFVRFWEKPKKERFEPKTLQPFDRVIAKICEDNHYIWSADFVSYINNDTVFTMTYDGDPQIVIPYNDETKHLVGTRDEAPEYYRYWED